MLNKRIYKAAYVLFFLCICAAPLQAQFDAATVLGAVRDASGSVIPDVNVELKNVNTGLTATSQTDSKGEYQFLNVKIGTYNVTASKIGFSTATAQSFDVAVNARQRVDLTLQIGNVSSQISVTADVRLLETDTSEKGQVIQSREIAGLPLNGRSYANLTLLVPGVSESNQNGIGTSGREGAFNVNGLRNTANNFLLDGVDNNAYGTSNQGFSSQVVQPSPDAIAEFKVQTNTYSAEYGRSGGAVINASYRSGTNDFHVVLWEFNRNTVLNAVGFFQPAGGVKPTLNRNQFGGTFGGPIKRDRTFFFMDYEGFRQIQKTVTFATIPSLEQRSGVLTVPVTDPITGQTYPARSPLPMTNFARQVLSDLPLPNVPGASANNYQKTVPNRSYYDKFNLRVDHKISDVLSVFARAGQQKNNALEAPAIDGPSGGNSNGQVNVMSQQLVGGLTYLLRGSSVLEFRIGISRTKAGKTPIGLGGPNMLDKYGITGLPTDPQFAGGLTPQAITGYTQLGRQSTSPQFQNPTNIDPRVSYAWNLGQHSLKFGAEFMAVNTDVEDTNPLIGLDSYNSQFSRPQGAAASNLYNLADFMLGARTQYALATAILVPMRQRFYFGYVQDDVRVNPKLTLNVGLRYEFATPYYSSDNRMSNFDPATRSLVNARDGSIYDRALVDPDTNDFAPRLGFAYSPNDKTVLRGGYGIGFNHFNRLASAGLLATNYPYVTRSTITQSTTGMVNGRTVRLPVCTGNAFSGCFRPTQAGYPSGLPNDVSLYIPRNTPDGYIQNWQFSIQRQLPGQTVLELGYVGNHSVKMAMLADYNQARPPLPGENVNATLDARRPIQGFGTISVVLPAAFSNYHSLQAKVEHRFSKGVYLLNSFTWSKAIDNATQVLEDANGSTGTPQNIYNLSADRGLSSYDQPFINITSAVWQIPVGRGRAFANRLPALADAVLGGWQINAINTARSGRPINLRYATSGPTPVTAGLATFLGGVALRPNLLGDLNLPEGESTIDRYFNTQNVVIPPATQPFGTAGRNTLRSYAFYQLDLGLQKNFRIPIRESARVEFRAEAFNLLNKTNFGAANGDRSSGAFGTVRSTYAARQIQLALKLLF